MKTAVDTSVLPDVLGADPRFWERSREALRQAYDAGALEACDVVWSEVRAQFATPDPFYNALEALGVAFEPVTAPAAEAAGELWRHARLQADALLTRDRGFFREGFADLRVLDPSTDSPSRSPGTFTAGILFSSSLGAPRISIHESAQPVLLRKTSGKPRVC